MPGIPQGLTGLRQVTPEYLTLDAGQGFKNINISKLTSGLVTAFADAINSANTWTDPNGNTVAPAPLGATRDGDEVDPGKEQGPVDFDGRRFPTKGMERIKGYEPKLSITLLEFADPITLQMALGSADITDHSTGGVGYKEIRPRLVINPTDYIGNIAIAARVSGSGLPIIIVCENALVMSNTVVTLKDKGELAVKVEFVPHSLITDPFTSPLSYWVPASVSGS